MRAALVMALALLAMLLAIESAAARSHMRGGHAHIQRGGPAVADDGYFARYITGPGGQRIPLREYPGSAYVVTRKMMDDFQTRTICDALRFAPGVSAGGC